MKSSYRVAAVFAIVICVGLVLYYRTPGSGGTGDPSITMAGGETPTNEETSKGAAPSHVTPAVKPTTTAGTSTPPTRSGESTASRGESWPGGLEDLVTNVMERYEAREAAGSQTTTTGGTPSSASTGTTTTRSTTPVATSGTSTAAGTATSGTSRIPGTSTAGSIDTTTVPAVGPVGVTTSTSPRTTPTTVTTTTPSNPPRVEPTRSTPPVRPAVTGRTYTIRSGDTLSTIAEDTYGSQKYWFDIAQANPLTDPEKLKIGQVIRLPDINTTAPVTTTDIRPEHGPGSGIEYIVRPDDTLSSIARQFYNDPEKWSMLHDVNRTTIGADPNRLKVGMKLRIPPSPKGAS